MNICPDTNVCVCTSASASASASASVCTSASVSTSAYKSENPSLIDQIKKTRVEQKIQQKEYRLAKKTKAEKKLIYDEQERIRENKRIEKHNEQIAKFQTNPFNFTPQDYETGQLSRNLNQYKIYDPVENKIKSVSRKQIFPSEFLNVSDPVIFNNTYWIGIDDDNKIYDPDTNFNPMYDVSTITGIKQNPRLKIFNKNTPENILTIPVNIYGNFANFTCKWFIETRPDRIYLSDFDGLKIFNFNLDLLHFIPIETNSDFYAFGIDNKNWNEIWVWNVSDALKLSNYHDELDKNKQIMTRFEACIFTDDKKLISKKICV